MPSIAIKVLRCCQPDLFKIAQAGGGNTPTLRVTVVVKFD
jgi:hypothetical protein